ncbi:hypothetical protein EV586_101580 [Tumebacillus sp. BK434]|nr:hypothetical protein [Tumebacillus sp. BK434]TCP59364.1 hypothetical protein EV586_101580 [Tumebacillus sp. BK434]
MPSYEDDLSRFEEHNTHVPGIRLDSVPSHDAWEKSVGGITYPLLSDFYPPMVLFPSSTVFSVLKGCPNPLCSSSTKSCLKSFVPLVRINQKACPTLMVVHAFF